MLLSKNSERVEYARRCEVMIPPARPATSASAPSSAGFAIMPGKYPRPHETPTAPSLIARSSIARISLSCSGGGLAGIGAHHRQPDAAVAREMRDVHREALALQMRAELRDLAPLPLERSFRKHLRRGIEHRGLVRPDWRGGKSAIATDECRDALEQERAQNFGVLGNRNDPIRMRMHIDEAGRDDETGRIDLARSGCLRRLGGRNQFGDFSATSVRDRI